MQKKTKQIIPKHQNSFKKYLDSILVHTKKNTHSGVALSNDLKSELSRIEKRVAQTLRTINKEAETDDSPDNEVKIEKKLEQTTKLLTDEMVQLTALYHRQKDIALIRSFLNRQRDVIHASMRGPNDEGKMATGSLDTRIEDLHGLMQIERKRISQAARKERLKFLVSLLIGLTSLALGMYALIYK
jgi:hypothetical protein